jgi:hypothetical protein
MEDVCYEPKSLFAIGRSLGRICRWAGNACYYFSVFQHSLAVSYMCPPEIRLHGLLHDCAESWTCDVTHNYKREDFREQERAIMAHLYKDLGLILPTPEQSKIIKIADNRSVVGEVWTGAGVESLREEYPERDYQAEMIVEDLLREWPYARLLGTDDAAHKFERLFYQYKAMLQS